MSWFSRCSWCGGPFNGGNCRCCTNVSFGDEFVRNPNPIVNDETPDFSYPPPQPQTSSLDQFHCFHCKDPLEDGVRCQQCTCVRCGYYLGEGFYSFCNSEAGNSFVYDSNPNSFNDLTNYSIDHQEDLIEQRISDVHDRLEESHNELLNMLQSFCEMIIQQKQTASIDQSPLQEMSILEMEDLKQHYLDEMLSLSNDLQIKDYRNEKIDIRFRRECESMIDELKGKFNGMSIEINKKKELQHLEQVANLSTYPSQRFKSFCYDDDDDYDYEESTIPLNEIDY
ncbi:hypothetical protein Tco_1175888 [Tanacetum coccineum]